MMQHAADNPARIFEANLVPAIFLPWARDLIALARPQPGERVLDAACGTGAVARLAAPMVAPQGRVVGIDFDPAMLSVARGLRGDVEWHEGNVQRLPFADASFDLVLCQQGLQFVPDRAKALGEMHRVLRPGGRVALSLWTKLERSPGHAAAFRELGELLAIDTSRPSPFSLADATTIRSLLCEAGFAEIELSAKTRTAVFPSAASFIETLIAGASKLTRQAFAQIPGTEQEAFVARAAARLAEYATGRGVALPMESHLVLARKA